MATSKSSELNIPTTVEDWQLYEMPGAGVAARALTAALKKAVTAVKRGAKPMVAYEQFMPAVMDKYDNFGASDTEPRSVAMMVLKKAAGPWHGFSAGRAGGSSGTLRRQDLMKRLADMRRSRIGEKMLHWHSAMGDPIYAVGSFYISGHEYPDLNVVRDARANLSEDLSKAMNPVARKRAGWKAADVNELRQIIAYLDKVIGNRRSS